MKGLKLLAGTMAAIVALTAIPVTYVHADDSGIDEVVASVNLTHEHRGVSTTKGYCYSGAETYHEGCTNKLTYLRPDYNASADGSWGLYVCPSGHYVTRSCHNAVGLTCGMGAYYSYALSCGLAEGSITGVFQIKKTIENEIYTLSPLTTTSSTMCVITSCTWDDGTVGELAVTENGTYSCTLSWKDNGIAKTETLTYTVTDYDTEPPVITALTPDKTSWTKGNVIVTVTATDNYSVTGYRLNDGAWETSNKLTVMENGTYTVYAKDAIGNVSEGRNITIRNIDRTVPLLTINPVSADWTKEDVTVTFLATDNSNDTVYYAVSENNSLTAEQVTGTETSYTATHNGTYYVYAKDKAGNVAKKVVTISNIDRTAPVITIDPFPSDWTNQDMQISFSATDNSSDTILYAMSESDSLTSAQINSTETTCRITANGTYYVYAKDKAGNIAKRSFTIGSIDKEKPVIQIHPFSTAWTNTGVDVTYSATDNSNDTVYYAVSESDSLDAGSITGAETSYRATANGTYYVYAKDKAQNVAKESFTISCIDTEAPVITIENISEEWTASDITVRFSATDNSNDTIYYTVSESGSLTAEQVTGTETSCTVTHNGTYYVYAKDLAGNIAKKIFNISSIDKTAPVIQIHPFTTDWTNQDIRISFSATDNSNDTLVYAVSESDSLTAGEVTGNETSFLVTENSTYYVYAKDLAGNIAKKEVTVSNIDKTAPVITVDEISTAYTNTAYDITFSATDDASGILYYTVSLNGSLAKDDITGTDTSFEVTENNLYYVYAVDRAGNVGKKEVLITNLDFTPPDGSVALVNGLEVPNGSFIWTDKVTVRVSASDNIALAAEAYNFDSEGYAATDSREYRLSGSYSVKVRDHVGNEKEIPFTIDNIDSTAPAIGTLQFIYADEDGNTVTATDLDSLPKLNQMDISYTAEDTESGLPVLAYRYKNNMGEWSDWGSETVISGLLYNGTYTIEVKDNCGNVSTKSVTLTNLLEEFPVTYLDVDENGQTLGSVTKRIKIGQMVAGSEMGIDQATGAYYEGYDYINCDTITVGTEENVVHRFFKRHYYNVKYYDDVHNVLVEENVPYGGQATAPEIPTKKSIKDTYYVYEYTFAGWVDRDGNPVNLSAIKKDTVLFPTFKESKVARTYTVKFMVDGTVYDTQEVIAGENAVAPHTPGKAGYTFSGWDRSFVGITDDLTVYAIFAVNPSRPQDNTPEIITTTPVLPSAEDIEILANTEVEYIESQIQSEKKTSTMESSADEPDLDDLYARITVINESTPLAGFFKPIRDLYTDENTKGIAVTTTAAVGVAATYSLVSIVCSALGGLSLTQLLIFGYMLLRKKVRFVRGAWLTDTNNVRYVDKYGRTVTVESEDGILVFKRKGKVLHGVDVSGLLEKLNANKISYKEFEDIIAESEVYTSFSKDLEIETWNVKSSHGKVTSKAKGFSLTKNLSRAFDTAGSYAVRLSQNGKQALFEIRYAMASV